MNYMYYVTYRWDLNCTVSMPTGNTMYGYGIIW